MLMLKESFDAVGTKFNGLTWQRIEKSHLEFSHSQTQELIDWKESMMKVHNELDLQGIGTALELPLGSSIAPQVLPKVKELIEQNTELVELLKEFIKQGRMSVIGNEKANELLTKYNHLNQM